MTKPLRHARDTLTHELETESILALALTETGLELARSLGLETRALSPTSVLSDLWDRYDVFVIVAAIPIAIRLIAPLLRTKATDPAIVCLDETGAFAVPLIGVHHGANRVANTLSKLLGATVVTTTPSDLGDHSALDLISGMTPRGSVASVQRHLNEGGVVQVIEDLPWPLPARFPRGESSFRVIVSDRRIAPQELDETTAQLVPPSLIVGVGTSTTCSTQELRELLTQVLLDHELDEAAIACLATIDRRRDHPALTSLGLPIRSYTAEELDRIVVPSPSVTVHRAVGTSSVCEAAALLASESKGDLIVTKERSNSATIAIVRRSVPSGTLFVVGIGPGSPLQRTREAEGAITNADVVVGYSAYLELCEDLLHSGQLVVPFPIGQETERVDRALEEAIDGQRVALVCSGDPGVYAMASLVFQRIQERNDCNIEVTVVPGVTAALAASAEVGAIFGHDHAYLSLSDLLTPWKVIRDRIEALGPTDIAIALYNPRSRERRSQLDEAIEILRSYRPPSTVVAIARRVSRPGATISLTTLAEFDSAVIDMETVILIGSSTTRQHGSRAYTPRGYGQRSSAADHNLQAEVTPSP